MLTAAAAIRSTTRPSAFFFPTNPSFRFNHPFLAIINNIQPSSISAEAKKRDDDSAQQQTQSSPFSLKFSAPSSSILIQSAITLFGLGFVDAGYSGDWSRIGVISKDNEELLKVLAFLVAPLCVILIYTLSPKQKDKSSD